MIWLSILVWLLIAAGTAYMIKTLYAQYQQTLQPAGGEPVAAAAEPAAAPVEEAAPAEEVKEEAAAEK